MVTAVVEAGGANTLTSPAAVLSAYRPALYLITGVAALGLVAALPGLRRRSAAPADEVDYFDAAEAPAPAEPKAVERNPGLSRCLPPTVGVLSGKLALA